MKRILFGLLVFCAFCMFPAIAIENSHPDGIAYAEKSLLQYIPNGDTAKYNGMSENTHGSFYRLTTSDKSEYYVNSRSMDIERVDTQFDWKQTRDVKVSLETAEKAAQTVIDRFSSKQNRSDLKIVKSQLIDHGAFSEYSVEFKQIVNGIEMPNAALISINPSNGELLSYMSINEPVTVSLNPELSEEEALKIAIDQYPGLKVADYEANLKVVFPESDNQKLVYRITLIGEPVDNMMYGGFLAIDAMDGRVWYNSPFK
jgi:Zn-dependent metalloprotease